MIQNIARQASAPAGPAPWFERALRWSFVDARSALDQTPDWWRGYWQRISAQGVVIPASDGRGALSAATLVAAARRDGHVVVLSHDIGAMDRISAAAALARDTVPCTVEGDGYIGAYLNQQDRRLILHLFNGTGVDNGEDITDRFYPVGPLRIRVRAPESFKRLVRLLAAERTIPAGYRGGFLEFEVPAVGDYEVAVIE